MEITCKLCKEKFQLILVGFEPATLQHAMHMCRSTVEITLKSRTAAGTIMRNSSTFSLKRSALILGVYNLALRYVRREGSKLLNVVCQVHDESPDTKEWETVPLLLEMCVPVLSELDYDKFLATLFKC